MNEHIQAIGAKYFADRNEQSFAKFYNDLKPLVLTISKKILTDQEAAEENVSRVFMKIYRNDRFVFDPKRSFLSYVYNTTKNSAIVMYNSFKKRKEVCESELTNEHNEDMESLLDYLYVHNTEDAMREVDQTNIEDREMLHNSPKEMCKRVMHIIDRVSDNEQDAEILKDVLFRGIGPDEVKEIYGLKSRITITSRRRRGLQKIRKELEKEINASKLDDGDKLDGEVKTYHKNEKLMFFAQVKGGKLNGRFEKWAADGNMKCTGSYRDGFRHGEYRELHQDGSLKLHGKYEDDKKTGLWERFYENGKLEESVDHSRGGSYVLFDESGAETESGALDGRERFEEKYPNGNPKKFGWKLPNGTQVGLWERFYENGIIEESVDYDRELAFKLFDESGVLEEEGNLRR